MRVIFTDGCCLVNPGGPGGWAYVYREGGRNISKSGSDPDTTNNIMEMTAVIKAIEAQDCQPFKIVSDSKYVVNGINSWMASWQSRGWKKKGGAIKNLDLWKRLFQIVDPGRMTFEWIKGHDGNFLNEQADGLAGVAAEEASGKTKRSSGDSVDTQRAISNDSLLVGYCPMGCGQRLFRDPDDGCIRCAFTGCPNPDAVTQILSERETDHIIIRKGSRAVVRHPLRERIEDALAECPVLELAAHDPDLSEEGTYLAKCVHEGGGEDGDLGGPVLVIRKILPN